jgi:hypothetical protein
MAVAQWNMVAAEGMAAVVEDTAEKGHSDLSRKTDCLCPWIRGGEPTAAPMSSSRKMVSSAAITGADATARSTRPDEVGNVIARQAIGFKVMLILPVMLLSPAAIL